MLDKFRASPKILKHTHFAEAHSQKPSFSGWWKDSETSIQVLYVCSVAKSFLHLNIVKVKWTLPGVNVPTRKTLKHGYGFVIYLSGLVHAGTS